VSFNFIACAQLPTKYGVFTIHAFEDSITRQEQVALTMGDLRLQQPALVRIHSECLTGDSFGSLRCDCGPQLDAAMKRVAAEGRGLILYLRQEGRGIGLVNKVRAYALQDSGADTVEANEQLGFAADLREYSMCELMLQHLGVSQVRLMTNNPLKVEALAAQGLDVVERVPLIVGNNAHNQDYLQTKVTKMGHMLSDDDLLR
jgi:GTP cyclohydrolase II